MSNINQYNETTGVMGGARPNEVTCVDGTKDISNGKMPPCTNNGGVKEDIEVVRTGTLPEFVVKTATQGQPVSDLEYYLSPNFLKRASYSVVPVALIGGYCYYKKFSLGKSALLVSIPIVAITIMQNIGFGGGKNAYWGIFIPPSVKRNSMKQIQLTEIQTGIPQKI